MGGTLRSAAAGLGYALVGAVLLGGVGIIIGILIDTDAGLEGMLNAAIAGGVGAVIGAILGSAVYVWGGKALERQQQRDDRHSDSAGSNP